GAAGVVAGSATVDRSGAAEDPVPVAAHRAVKVASLDPRDTWRKPGGEHSGQGRKRGRGGDTTGADGGGPRRAGPGREPGAEGRGRGREAGAGRRRRGTHRRGWWRWRGRRDRRWRGKRQRQHRRRGQRKR